MRSENGKGTIKWILIICVIAVVVVILGRYVYGIYKKEKVKNFQADILLVQARIEGVKGKYILNKDENPLKGIKVSERTEEYKIDSFLQQGIIKEEDYEKYYILNETSLNEMELQSLVGKYKGYFIVNYDDFEVIYTAGYENENGVWCYKVSEMKKEKEVKIPETVFDKEEQKEENTEESQGEDNAENNAEQTEENSNAETSENTNNEQAEEKTEDNGEETGEETPATSEDASQDENNNALSAEDEAKINYINNKLKLNLNK